MAVVRKSARKPAQLAPPSGLTARSRELKVVCRSQEAGLERHLWGKSARRVATGLSSAIGFPTQEI
jgi:hypothetical protein